MLEIGVQSKNVVFDDDPAKGFEMLRDAGFTCCDFSLNEYLLNIDLYNYNVNSFFKKSDTELEKYFTPHRDGAKMAGIRINQMHMPYPTFIPGAPKEQNDFLWNEVAPKSMRICKLMDCHNIVIHGLKLKRHYGTEEAEWAKTEEFIRSIAPMAKEMSITICMENLYNSLGNHLVEGPCCDADKAVERMERINDEFGAEVLGFCFDTGHANLVGIDFEDFLEKLGKHLKVLHIHDNDGVADLHQLPFTFAKTRENLPSTDWDGFIKGLRNIHFDRVLSFETAPVLTTFPDEMKAETLEFIYHIGKCFINQIKK